MEIIKLNLIPTGVNPTCHCSQYDEGRVIRIELFDGLTPYTLQSGDTVTLNVRKPDNTIVTTSVTATQGNKYVDIVTTEQICAVVGYNLCDLTITNGSVVIGTLNFIMQIERDVLADGIPSQSVIEDLDALVQEAVGDNYYTKTEVDDALDLKADKSTTYTKTEVDSALALKANSADVYTKTQADEKIAALIDDTQALDNKTWSSQEILSELTPINKQLGFISKDLKLLYDGNDNFSIGIINALTGELIGSYSNYRATDFIKIENYKDLFVFSDILTSGTSNAGCAFYDTDKQYISGVNFNIESVASNEVKRIDIPNNAVYFRTCIKLSELSDFFVEVNTFRVIETEIAYIEKDIKLLYDSNGRLENGYIVATTGNIGGTAAYKTTDYIDVSNISLLSFYAPILVSGATSAGCAFYDENKTYISGVKFNVGAVASAEIMNVEVPQNAVYFRTSCRASELSNFYVAINTFRVLESEIKELQNKTPFYNFGLQLFEKIGVISDSISVGWAKDKNGHNSRRNLGISWVQQLARRLGCTAYNLGASGVDPIEWFQTDYEFYEYCYPQYQSVGFCDLYIIGLGLNGSTLGTISDINESDYTQNASSFYGQYARIIQMINAEHPSAIVVCLTEPTTRISEKDQAVRNICALNFINAQLLDLENDYFDIFNTPEIRAERQPDGLHYTPYGYSLLAESMAYALNDYISKNSSVFKYVGVANV